MSTVTTNLPLSQGTRPQRPGTFYNPIDVKWPGRDEFGGRYFRRTVVEAGLLCGVVCLRRCDLWFNKEWERLRRRGIFGRIYIYLYLCISIYIYILLKKNNLV